MTTTPSAAPLPPDPIVRPEQVKASPFYWPNLIAALIASIAIAVGSIGPWAAFMGMTKSAMGGDGNITLTLGIVAALALFALLNFGRTEVRSKRMVALGVVAAVAGVVAFVIALVDAKDLASRSTEFMGSTIGPDIGWGLWMILIGGPVLAVTSAIVVKQVRAMAKGGAGVDARSLPPAQPVPPPSYPVPAPESPSASTEAPGPTSYWDSPSTTDPALVAATAPAPPPAFPLETPRPPAQTTPPAPIPTAMAAVTPLPTDVGEPPVFDYPMAPTALPAHNGDSPRSVLRRIAPWAGGAAALAAAFGTGVWAAPYLTGAGQTTNNGAMPAITKTVTSTAAPSPTMSSTQATAADSPAASGEFGPFDNGDAKVFVDGKPREVRGSVNCFESSDGFLIGIDPPGNKVIVKLSKDLSRVLQVGLGMVEGKDLPAFLDGAASGNASVTNDGKSHRITGTVPTGYSATSPTLPFEIDVTCP